MTMSMNDGIEKRFRYGGEELVVDKETDDVVYNDEKHIYVGKDGLVKDKKFISVTTLIENYVNKFDEEFWKRYKALEELLGLEEFAPIKKKLLNSKKWNDSYIPSYIDISLFESKCAEYVEKWKKENKKACDWGTGIHAEQENGFYNKPKEMIKKFGLGGNLDVIKNHHKLDIERGIIPEMLLTSISNDGILRIAGQSDLIVKDGNNIQVIDYKTNKKLDKKSYYDPVKKSYQMMKYPLNHIMDCNLMHYTLQLSLYAWMIQKSNPEFIIDELRIIHFKHEGGVDEYVLDYLKDDILRMLRHYKKQIVLDSIQAEFKPIIF